jgi:hypothetical protein
VVRTNVVGTHDVAPLMSFSLLTAIFKGANKSKLF